MKFIVKDCDPATGEADEDGYDDEYRVGSCCRPLFLQLTKHHFALS